eukprot:TRINITY_DN28373_c0_g2_i1.p1 TRINITY_DN28373_c0_g2~~TRINITY_DN28373_c0_g2_i1.p1  ORF type:complete len:418 (+),score=79.26 TRINITY_DN28373_c0_g2_i1:81-1256(+)
MGGGQRGAARDHREASERRDLGRQSLAIVQSTPYSRGGGSTRIAGALKALGVELAAAGIECLSAAAPRLLPLRSSELLRRFEHRPLNEVLALLMVAMMMGTVYFSYVFVYLALVRDAAVLGQRAFLPLIFRAAFGLAVIAYHQGVVTDPGGIPDTWRVDGTLGARQAVEAKCRERKRSTNELRFCAKEHKYKPDRAHYCSAMQRNVLRMDHYCPWLGNCVGHRNHKYFLLFLLYTSVSTTICAVSVGRALLAPGGVSIAGADDGLLPAGAVVFLCGTLLLSATLVLLLLPFFGFHLWLLSKNMTTIEYCERRSKEEVGRSIYDLGFFDNVSSILGSNPLLWLCPFAGEPPGDGLEWSRPSPPSTTPSLRRPARRRPERMQAQAISVSGARL